ncbi:DNA polymerase I [Bdellovibrionota bacterium FG-2]
MPQKNIKTLYLLDISSFIFRAFYAIRPLHTSAGEPTNAVFGVASMMAKLFDEAKPEYFAVTFDSKEPSHRKLVYAEYKANRTAPPDELIQQFSRIEELVNAFGAPGFRRSGVEADDLIATLTKKWCAAGADHEVVIVTGDKDLMQLVSTHVKVWDTMAGKTYDPGGVQEKFGVPPHLIRDYLAMVGDSSDNIPGVAGIGPKGACELLNQYGGLEPVLAAAEQGLIAGKKGETLRTHVKEARLSLELATLHEDLPIDAADTERLGFQFRLTPELREFLHKMELGSLLKRWDGQAAPVGPVAPKMELASDTFRTINTEAAFADVLRNLERVKEFGFDLETTSLNPRTAKLVGIALCYDPGFGCYIPIGHRDAEVPQLTQGRVLSALKPFLENPRFKKIGQNLKYDWSVLYQLGLRPDGIGADTMVASYVLDPEGRHNLKVLAAKYLNYEVLPFEAVCGEGKKQIGFDEVSVAVATRYSAEDAWIALKLWHELKGRLQAEGAMEVFAKIDLPLVDILARMESQGVCIDKAWLAQLSCEFGAELKLIEEKVAAFTREPVNLNSPKQLAKLLFEDLCLPAQTKTKTGLSTDASVLEALAPLHEVPCLLLEYREIAKLKGTYVDPLPELFDPVTGKIHASFHQAVTATGRLSSSDPNLQNIPVRSERGLKIRRGFVASPGNVLVSADYSQIELRILAHMSGDIELSRSFQKDEDVHKRTAGEIYGIPLDQVTDHQRSIAKAINFGLMYGKTAFGLAQELKISRREAQETIDRYFVRYEGVKVFLGGLISDAKERGYTQTLFGRRRKLPDLLSKNGAVRANAERMAMNTPIQGTAADLMKLAMIELDHRLVGFRSRLIVQVHDEVLLDCPREEAEVVRKLVCEVMENVVTLSVPLRVNSSQGVNWMEL